MKEIVFIPIISCCAYLIINLWFYKKKSTKHHIIDGLYYFIFITIIVLQVFNIYNFICDNFVFNSVYSHSEKNIPMIYKVTAAFSGKEGSFLLWLTCLGIVGIFFNIYINSIMNSTKNIFLYKALFILFPLFLSIALIFNNPFELTPANIDIVDGLGLKLVLQSYYNIVHPPLVFIGFSVLYIPYIICISTLLKKNDIEKKIINAIVFWNKLGVLLLSAGIITGSLWAYNTLGWGGFWGWDPIENAALIPLLLSFSVLHFSAINKKSNTENSLLKTIFLLSILIFPMIILCTFLARSGLLIDVSVHSYISSRDNIITYILLFLILILFLSLFLFVIRINFLKSHQQLLQKQNIKKNITILGLIVLLCIPFVVLCGTVIPVIGNKISNSFLQIDSDFYMLWCMPLTGIMLLLLGCSVLLNDKKMLKGRKKSFNDIVYKIAIPFIIAIIMMIILFYSGMIVIEELLFFFTCIFAIISQFQVLVIKILKTKKVKLVYFPSFLSHIGLIIFLTGAVLYGTFQVEEKIFLEKDKIFEMKNGLKCKLVEIDTEIIRKYTHIIPTIKIEYEKNIKFLKPKMVFTRIIRNIKDNAVTNTAEVDGATFDVSVFPGVLSVGLTDIYIEPLSIGYSRENTTAMSFIFSIKSYINVVWLGFMILLIGFIFSVIIHNKK